MDSVSSWIEFHWNRVRVIADQEGFFSNARQDLDSAEKQSVQDKSIFDQSCDAST